MSIHHSTTHHRHENALVWWQAKIKRRRKFNHVARRANGDVANCTLVSVRVHPNNQFGDNNQQPTAKINQQPLKTNQPTTSTTQNQSSNNINQPKPINQQHPLTTSSQPYPPIPWLVPLEASARLDARSVASKLGSAPGHAAPIRAKGAEGFVAGGDGCHVVQLLRHRAVTSWLVPHVTLGASHGGRCHGIHGTSWMSGVTLISVISSYPRHPAMCLQGMALILMAPSGTGKAQGSWIPQQAPSIISVPTWLVMLVHALLSIHLRILGAPGDDLGALLIP